MSEASAAASSLPERKKEKGRRKKEEWTKGKDGDCSFKQVSLARVRQILQTCDDYWTNLAASSSERRLQGPTGMDKPYDFRERAFAFGVQVVGLCRVLARRDPILRHLAYQLVDSATSIGANLAESLNGQSKPDFISKLSIALKESRETLFWLRVFAASEPPIASDARPLIQEASEFVSMLTKSINTARSRPDRHRREP